MREMRNTYKILVGKPEGKRPLGRPRRRWEDNIRMDLREIRWKMLIGYIWLRMETSNGHDNEHFGYIKGRGYFLTS
jgi:hypothetical protein